MMQIVKDEYVGHWIQYNNTKETNMELER